MTKFVLGGGMGRQTMTKKPTHLFVSHVKLSTLFLSSMTGAQSQPHLRQLKNVYNKYYRILFVSDNNIGFNEIIIVNVLEILLTSAE